MKKAIVTGGAGFIGSNLVDRLLKDGYSVKVIDNFKTGRMEHLSQHKANHKLTIVNADIKDSKRMKQEIGDADIVFHLAANADVKGGIEHPEVDLQENSIGTSNVLEAMRLNGIEKIVFSSTCSVYGEPSTFPTPETCPFPTQTSFYAASKTYGEGLISAYCESYKMKSWIFRFVSIFGERYSHGVIFSFMKQLNENPKKLVFLSDGTPQKSYLYVGDCIEGIMTGLKKSNQKINIFNLGNPEIASVKEIADWVVASMGMKGVKYHYGRNQRGWVGDSPHIEPDVRKLMSLGWKPELTIENAVGRTVRYLKENPQLLGLKYFRDK